MLLQEVVSLSQGDQLLALEVTVQRHLYEFLSLHRRHPLPNHHPSYVSLSEAFWLWRLAADLKPTLVVESGTFHGYSAWWLSQAMGEQSFLHTFDPERMPHEDVLHQLYPTAWHHHAGDFKDWPYCGSAPSSLAFFDDHVDQGDRLRQAAAKGFKHVVFHDCYPQTWATSPEPLWRRGISCDATVLQFPIINHPAEFSEPARCGHSWLTYVQVR